MKRKNILISLGQMPAKLDAVKFIGNKFGGGLMLKLANHLAPYHHITIVKWKYNKIDINTIENHDYCPDFKVVDVDDIMSYMEYVKTHDFDAYILGAAVANLMPVNPWKGKFPSHNYKEGDTFDIKFQIAPRIINIVKQYHPKSTLIGFKLSTGCYQDANEVLHESKADLVVYNNAKNLQETALCYKTGLHEWCDRDELPVHIKHLLDCEIGFNVNDYVTKYFLNPSNTFKKLIDVNLNKFFLFKEMEKYVIDDENHGSIFFRDGNEFYTHTRYGKKFASIMSNEMMLDNMTVVENTEKYTQALPIFLHLQKELPQHNYFIHTHKEMRFEKSIPVNYLPPNNSLETTKTIIGYLNKDEKKIVLNSFGHGYFIAYINIEDMINDFSDRNWMYYDPPKRYVNDNSDIFNDILPKGIENCLEVGDNYYEASKITQGLRKYNIDPYTCDKKSHIIHYDLVVAKNCIPII